MLVIGAIVHVRYRVIMQDQSFSCMEISELEVLKGRGGHNVNDSDFFWGEITWFSGKRSMKGGGDYREMTANQKGSSEYYGALWGIREYSSWHNQNPPIHPQTVFDSYW